MVKVLRKKCQRKVEKRDRMCCSLRMVRVREESSLVPDNLSRSDETASREDDGKDAFDKRNCRLRDILLDGDLSKGEEKVMSQRSLKEKSKESVCERVCVWEDVCVIAQSNRTNLLPISSPTDSSPRTV